MDTLTSITHAVLEIGLGILLHRTCKSLLALLCSHVGVGMPPNDSGASRQKYTQSQMPRVTGILQASNWEIVFKVR